MIYPRVTYLNNPPVKANGFTIIELIVVIILLAIIALYTSSKYMGASHFSSAAAQEQVVSILRQVQITAMQSNTSDSSASCRSILMAADQFGVTVSCQNKGMVSATLLDYSKDANQQQLELIQLSYAFSSASAAISVSELSFDLLGRPTMVASPVDTRLCTTTDCRITITTPSTGENRSICINSEGFIYRSTHSVEC